MVISPFRPFGLKIKSSKIRIGNQPILTIWTDPKSDLGICPFQPFGLISPNWLKWADSQIGFDTFLQSVFGLISPNFLSNEIARKDKAIEIRSEIIRTMLGC